MKRIVLFLSLICMISTTSWTADDDNTYIPIPVLDNTTVTGRTHRTPAVIPIQAYYDVLINSIVIQFIQNIGDVEVAITNLSTGYTVEYEVDSRIGVTYLQTSGDVGTYQIEFLLSSGFRYEGQFEVH